MTRHQNVFWLEIAMHDSLLVDVNMNFISGSSGLHGHWTLATWWPYGGMEGLPPRRYLGQASAQFGRDRCCAGKTSCTPPFSPASTAPSRDPLVGILPLFCVLHRDMFSAALGPRWHFLALGSRCGLSRFPGHYIRTKGSQFRLVGVPGIQMRLRTERILWLYGRLCWLQRLNFGGLHTSFPSCLRVKKTSVSV